VRVAVLLILAGCAQAATSTSTMERIRIAPGGKGFQFADSGRPFTPWGFNYDHDESMRLLEDYWYEEWAKVEEDFREMKEMGATAVRIHLQLNRFMKTPEQPHGVMLARLARVLDLAERCGLYLDLTGLGCYRKADTPAWYENAAEKERWAAQARFWTAVSEIASKSPAVLCYNLMNEPVSPAGPGKVYHGGMPLGGYYYVERLTLDPGQRSREQVTREWIATVSAGIRKNDPGRCVTAGMFFLFETPNGLTLGPDLKAYADGLDYLSIHMYPKDATVDANLKLLETIQIGKPVVIEETFPLSCSIESHRRFLEGSRKTVSGWIGFYWGRSLAECRASTDVKDAFMLRWLEFFTSEGPRFNAADR
jgi:hypothetical protein